jgi:diacylglycerol kinase
MTSDPVSRPPSPAPLSSPDRSWARKFRDAFRGLKEGVRGQSSFFVHFFTAVAVVVAGLALGVSLLEWCVLTLCIAGVLTAEMFNSAFESMAKAITGESDPHLGNSLDIGSAAVLVASVGASIVGAIIFGHRLGILLGWW